MPDFDILIPGHYFCDLIFTGLSDLPVLGSEIYSRGVSVVAGGGALNTSVALRRLGVKVGWVGVMGNDFFSRFVNSYCRDEGLDTSLVKQLESPLARVTVALSYPADRAFVTYAEVPPDIIGYVRQVVQKVHPRHVHFAGLIIQPELPSLLLSWREQGIRVSMDCQHREETLDSPFVREILSNLDIFMPNAVEAQRLTRTDNLASAINILAHIVPLVVIKNGDQGAIARTRNSEYTAPAIPVTPLDTTGAGDVFNAGFLAAYLRGQDVESCLRWGNFCGGLSTLGYGGSAAPTLEQLQNWLKTNQPEY
jgi:sugar/nucleoside kinase (ribokinase family)